CAAMVARYLVNPANFTSRELEPVIGRMLWHIAPWTLIGFACAILCECFRGRSFRREIELAARSPERTSFDNAQTDSGASREKKARLAKTAVRAAMFALAVALLVLGAANGGVRDVLVKAINICTECIGLG
ncbi:MAG: CD1871A family CXXC motif-containing protein, partial [Clostridia bacterium]|nr:CD1871A family CXXC motif-containing protein [Clostridia bacterium]